MPNSIDPALVARLSGAFSDLAGEFTALGGRMDTVGRDMQSLHHQVRVTDRPEPAAAAGTGVAAATAQPGTATASGSPATAESAETTAPARAPAPDAGPSSGVRDCGVYTPDEPGPAAADPGDAGLGGADSAPSGASTPHTRGVPAAGGLPGWTGPDAVSPNTSAQSDAGTFRFAGSDPRWPDAGRAEWAPHGGPGPTTGPPVPPPWPGRPAGIAMYRQAIAQYPPGAGHPRSGAVPPRPPHPPNRTPTGPPWWQREGVISRILAVAGVAVTLIGVVMLLVLAAQAGIFGPVPRVVGGAVLSAALVGAGMRVYHRAGGRVGGIALAATGFAGAYLDVVAVTAIYDWLHPVPGFAAALAVAAAGVGLAVQWRSQVLAVLVVTGAAGLAPFVTTELAVLAFLIVLQVACFPVQHRYDWPFLHLVRTVPTVLTALAMTVGLVVDPPRDHRPVLLLTAAVVIAVAAFAGTISVVRVRPDDLVASLTCALGSTPLLAAPALFEQPAATVICGLYAAALLAVAATTLVPTLRATVRIPGHTALVAAVCGAFALLETCLGVTTSGTAPLALLLIAVGFTGVAGQARSRGAAALGAAFAVLGGLGFLTRAAPRILADQSLAADRLTVTTATTAITGLAVLAVGWWMLRRLVGTIDESVLTLLWIGGSAATLHLVTTATVSIAVAAGGANGFVLGHSIATIAWMAAALAALLYGLRNLGAETATAAKLSLGSGLLVTAAALAKLFLFDLATLDGVVRVAAFLVVGILLLVAGTRYARAFAESGTRDGHSAGPRT